MRLTSTFTKRRADQQDRYRRETRLAVVTAVNADGTYDVRLPTSDTSIRKVVNGSRAPFSVGNTVILQRIGGHRLMYQILATVADAAPQLSQYVDEWYDDDWLIGQLSLAIEGYESLNDALLAKVEKAGDTMWGPLSVPQVEVVDGVLYLGEAGAEAWGDGHLRLSDPVTGWTTLSALAGPGQVAVGTAFPSEAVEGDGCLRTDIADGIFFWKRSGVWIPEARALWHAQRTFEKVLRGTASGGGSPTTLSLVRTDSADNKGCFGHSDAAEWDEASTGTRCDDGGEWVEVTFRTSGGTVTLWQDSGHGTSGDNAANPVYLDGTLHGTWNQTANAGYGITGVPAGVHCVRLEVDAAAAAGEFTLFHEITYPGYGYVGKGVAGDTCELIADLGCCALCTLGIGRADDGGTANRAVYGEGIIHRLPVGSGASDQTPTRSAIGLGGVTAFPSTAMDTLVRLPISLTFTHDTVGYAAPAPGMPMVLDAAGGTRGRLMTNTQPYFLVHSPALAASARYLMAVSALVRVTAPGSGSAFAAGDVALCIATYLNTSAATSVHVTNTNSPLRAADLFRLEG